MQTLKTKVIGDLRFFSRPLAAEKLSKTEKTLRRWELIGYGPPVTRFGRDPYYEEKGMEQWARSLAKAGHDGVF